MNERLLREELARTRPPGAAQARERGRALALAAFDAARGDGGPGPSLRRRPLRATASAVALALALVVAGLTLTAPGAAVADWVRDVVARDSPAPRPAPALARLPAAGRLLVSAPGGLWIVQRDGSRRRLGAYRDATWSPRGLFVAATRDRQLVALDPRGDVRWALARPDRVHDPRWAPSGYRVAYRSGSALRVVAGDGSGDRQITATVGAVAAAWRPGSRHVLAYVDRRGRAVVADIDAGRLLRRTHAGSEIRRLQWSADGARLVLSGPRGVRTLDAASGAIRTIYAAPPGAALVDAELAPGGARLALLLRHVGGGYDVLDVAAARRGPRRRPRTLFGAAATISSVTWSPDGRLVLAQWPGADQWLFLPVRRGARAAAVAGIAAHFDPGAGTDPRDETVRIEGWCCS